MLPQPIMTRRLARSADSIGGVSHSGFIGHNLTKRFHVSIRVMRNRRVWMSSHRHVHEGIPKRWLAKFAFLRLRPPCARTQGPSAQSGAP